MTILYVDECGEEGFSETSSKWLIVGGVLQRDPSTLKNMVSAYDAFKASHCNDNWHFHFTKTRHSIRLGFIHAMRDCGMRALAVAIYKPSIRKKDNFTKRYYLYFYALRFLLEKATVWCREHGLHDELHVYLSSRRGLRLEDLDAYLRRVISSPYVSNDKMEWSYLRNQGIFIRDNKSLRGLQMADCVVSSIGQAWEKSRFGLYEPRYLKDMRPMFHHDSLTYDRAIKIWPSVPADLITGEIK
jgi:hypothetical protein